MFEVCSNEGTVSLSPLTLLNLPPPVLKKKIEPSGGFTKALMSSKSGGICMEVILLYKQDWEIFLTKMYFQYSAIILTPLSQQNTGNMQY